MSTFFIGDIHGHAEKLKALLTKLGFTLKGGVYTHPVHRIVFVGDLVDRGPGQIETIMIVRRMIDAGIAQAVMGNHELNAIAWYLPRPDEPDVYLRKRSEKNRHQHAAFLAETEHDPELHKSLVDWFLTLPLWIETEHYRVVHACWHPGYIEALKGILVGGTHLNYELVGKAARKGHFEFTAVEALLKGMEADLPEGVLFYDKENNPRTATRVTWWDTSVTTYREAAVIARSERDTMPDTPVPADRLVGYTNDKPLFIGHYWRNGPCELLSPYIACVDYSAGKGGPLVAYRWDGEKELDAKNFISTDT